MWAFRVSHTGVRDAARLQGAARTLHGRLLAVQQVEGQRLLLLARAEAPRRTGAFVAAHQAVITGRRIEIRVPAKLYRIITGGTRPHAIVPRRGRVLAFTVGGQLVFARRVHHPGTAPNPYLVRAWQAWQPGYGQAMDGVVAEFAAVIGPVRR